MNTTIKVLYIVQTVSPMDYAKQATKNNFVPCTIDTNGILWIGSDRVNRYDSVVYFTDRRNAINAIKRTQRYQKREKFKPTRYKITPIINDTKYFKP